jgi:glycerol-3-phosphate acyltransferase PlsX
MRIIIDGMGGDKAPLEVVKGAYLASLEYNASFILVGDKAAIERIAEMEQMDLRRFDIVNTSSVITMNDDPISVIRAKSDSSMSVALKLLSEGKGDAVVSTGNTGALFTGATLIVRKVKGIRRAAIASILPMSPPVLLLDSGANVTVTDEYLEQFAIMGSIYMQRVYGLSAPRVGLLNNGVEECKGTELQHKAYARLSESPSINFVGNVEANKIRKNATYIEIAETIAITLIYKSAQRVHVQSLEPQRNRISFVNRGNTADWYKLGNFQ